MPRIAYFDTFSGLSGDMVLGALVDAGLSIDRLRQGLSGLRLDGYSIESSTVQRGPFRATRVKVIVPDAKPMVPDAKLIVTDAKPAPERREHHHDHKHGNYHHHDHGHGHDHKHEHGAHSHAHHDHHHHGHAEPHSHAGGHAPHRHLADIRRLLTESQLPEAVRGNAIRVFERLAEAEGRVHGVPPETVHFHEVGAVDSIVDITGACLGLHLLEVEEVWCSPATVGTGFVHGSHGQMPLPAPATLELLRGIPVRQRETGFELTTPTGAALASTLSLGFGPMPPLVPREVGYGAGDDRPGPVPNVVRLILGEKSAGPAGSASNGAPGSAPGSDRVAVLETSIDDMSPQWLGYLLDRLLEAGALDVSVTPIQMKKSRAAHELRVLAPLALERALAEILFQETTTFGIRRSEVDRLVLERSFETVATPWGDVRIKIGRLDGKVVSAAPEYEDVQKAARAAGVPLKEVHGRALLEYRKRQG